MNREFFNQQFAVLVNAYSIKLPDLTQDVYWEMLQPIEAEAFAQGVKACLSECKFFPTIAELGDASMPPVIDKRAPLPAVDHERPKIRWHEQLKRMSEVKKRVNGATPPLMIK